MTDSHIPDWLKSDYPFAPQWLKVPGGQLHYLDEGEGVPVVMLHGNPTWSFFYRNLIKELRPEFRCLVPDHIGMGLSDKPQSGYDYTLAERIRDMVLLVEHLELEKFHLIVHDWGGAIGMGLAEHFRERVGHIVVMNTAAFRSKRIPPSIALCKVPLIGDCIVRGLNGFALPATRMAVARPMSKTIRSGYIYPYQDWQSRIATHQFVKDIPLKTSHPSYAKLLEIEQGLEALHERPILLLWGMKDFCFDKTFLRQWQHRFPDAQSKELKNAGHYLLEDAPEQCNETIRRFLSTS